jgi:predicted RNase H-like nuclease (RuvC/YqgF family)
MPANEGPREGADTAGELGELRADVRHLQSDVTELKSEVRAVNIRIDSLRDSLIERMDSAHTELRREIASGNAELRKEIASGDAELRKEFGELRKETAELRKDMVNEFKCVRASLARAQIWALMLYILLAGGLLTAMAKGFKWI